MAKSSRQGRDPKSVPQISRGPLRTPHIVRDPSGSRRKFGSHDTRAIVAPTISFVDWLISVGVPATSARGLDAHVGMVASANLPDSRQESTLKCWTLSALQKVFAQRGLRDTGEVPNFVPEVRATDASTPVRDLFVVPNPLSAIEKIRGLAPVNNVTRLLSIART